MSILAAIESGCVKTVTPCVFSRGRQEAGLSAGFTAIGFAGVLDHVGLANADIRRSESFHDEMTDRTAIFQAALFKLVDDVLGKLDSDAPPISRGALACLRRVRAAAAPGGGSAVCSAMSLAAAGGLASPKSPACERAAGLGGECQSCCRDGRSNEVPPLVLARLGLTIRGARSRLV